MLDDRSPRPKTSSPSSGNSFKVAQGSQAATIMEATSTSPSSPGVPALVTYEQSALDEEMVGLEMRCGMEIMCTSPSGGDVAGNVGAGNKRDTLPGDLNLIFEVHNFVLTPFSTD